VPKLVLTHRVADVDTWLGYNAQRVADLAPFGSNITDHVAMDGSNSVAVSIDVHDMAGLQAAMASPDPDRVASMASQGIILPVMALIEK
jgi:hypothetical protein